jgi:hypothetical protein
VATEKAGNIRKYPNYGAPFSSFSVINHSVQIQKTMVKIIQTTMPPLHINRTKTMEPSRESQNTGSRETVLLLGNGINRLSGSVSWDDLINELLALSPGVQKGEKSFPLLYEEIFARYKGRTSFPSRTQREDTGLLEKIAVWTTAYIPVNPLNELIWQNYRTVLTTNYDYALEGGERWTNGGSRETRYSLHRKYSAVSGEMSKTVWHIHGEAALPQTICLGYEHYAGSLQTMRGFLTIGKRGAKPGIENIYSRIEQLRANGSAADYRSWMDYFFCADIDIAALNLGEGEIDLWWLLVFRSRLLKSAKYPITNRIRYFDNKGEAAKRDRHELLEALGVTVIVKNEPSWETFYRSIFEQRYRNGQRAGDKFSGRRV